jgi:hypothetical protein
MFETRHVLEQELSPTVCATFVEFAFGITVAICALATDGAFPVASLEIVLRKWKLKVDFLWSTIFLRLPRSRFGWSKKIKAIN